MSSQELRSLLPEFRNQILVFFVAALAFVATLTWNTFIGTVLNKLIPTGNYLLAQFIHAIIITIIFVIILFVITLFFGKVPGYSLTPSLKTV